MEMTISAVMVGASSQPQSKASDTGFSDVLTEVRAAAPQSAETTANQPAYDASEDYQAEDAYMTEADIAVEIDETVMTELKNTVISLVSKANGGNAEENDRIISALLDILKKMNDDSEEDPVMNLIMELLASMTGDVKDSDMFSLNMNVTEITRTETTEITAILGAETEAPVVTADVQSAAETQQPSAAVQTAVEPEQTAQFGQMVENAAELTAATQEMPAQPVAQQPVKSDVPVQTEQSVMTAEAEQPDYNGLLKDILSAAREELGLTKAEFTAKPAAAPAAQEMPVQPETQPAAQQSAFNLAFNRKDGTDELNSILGLGTEKTAETRDDGQEIKAVTANQDNSAVFAGNVPQKTQVVTAEPQTRVEAPLPEQQIADEILTKPEVFEGGRTEFTMELNPESLGKITVRLVSTEGRVEVNIAAENDATRQLLEARAENIGTALRNNGVELERYQVVSGQEEAMLMQESYDGSSRNPYGRNDEEQTNEESDEDFLEILQQL